MILREATLKYLMRSPYADSRINPAIAHVAEAIASKYESSPGKKDGWEAPELPWRKILETAASAPQLLREAIPSTAQGQLLRAGIQLIANAWYKRYPGTYTQVAQTVASSRRQEFYAPLFGAARPQEIKAGTPFREQGVKGQDLEVINRKFGQIFAFERELFDDDQTGQIGTFAQRLGESMAMWQDQYFSRKFIGVASSDFAPSTIEASKWTGENNNGDAITTPFSVKMYRTKQDTTDIGNRPTTFVQLSYGPLLTAFQRLRQAKDPLGQAIVVIPDTLLVSTFDEINGRMLTMSPAFPAVSGLEGETAGAASAGFFRGPFGINPVQGEFKLVVNIHLVAGVWSLLQGHKGYIEQVRDPMEITQEQPQSGDSFVMDAYRFRSRARWEQDWLDPRFAYLGNDGSASISQ
jgi:hypothetical protein